MSSSKDEILLVCYQDDGGGEKDSENPYHLLKHGDVLEIYEYIILKSQDHITKQKIDVHKNKKINHFFTPSSTSSSSTSFPKDLKEIQIREQEEEEEPQKKKKVEDKGEIRRTFFKEGFIEQCSRCFEGATYRETYQYCGCFNIKDRENKMNRPMTLEEREQKKETLIKEGKWTTFDEIKWKYGVPNTFLKRMHRTEKKKIFIN